MHILFILELIGTIVFAGSGAIVGIQKRMDLFGVCILGLTTSVGGGILRDLILNITPPAATASIRARNRLIPARSSTRRRITMKRCASCISACKRSLVGGRET